MLRKIHFIPVALILLLVIPLFSFAKADKSHLPSNKVFRVILDGTDIGTVRKKESVQAAIQHRLSQLQKQYPHLTFAAPTVTYKAERASRPSADDSAVQWIDERLKMKAKAVVIQFGSHSVALQNEKDANTVIEQLKTKYAPSRQAKASQVLNVALSVEPVIEKANVDPEAVLSVQQALSYITKGTLKEQIHTVRQGEVLGTIAEQYGLTTEQLLSLNPGVTVDSLLQIGQKLHVTVYRPLIDVIVEKQTLQLETVPYEIEVILNDHMYKGDTKVKQEGANGQKQVLYRVTETNGKITKKAIIKETTIKAPVKKIVIKGTKVLSSRGTGRFAWPTSGGYVSSRMGYRWGVFHKGTDIAGASGSPIYAADNGTVVFAGWDGDYGKKIVINHNNGFRTVYAHLSSIHVKVGQTVPKGAKIGTMGSTGHSTGPHLHIELYKNGQLVDFLKYRR